MMRPIRPTLGEVAWSTFWVLVFLALVLSHQPLPLRGDQGLYLYGAKELADGAVLYKDFWDLKAPGVYFFYLLAGSLFGFSVAGLHVLEAVWLGVAAWFAFRIARVATSTRWVAPLAPFLTVGA